MTFMEVTYFVFDFSWAGERTNSSAYLCGEKQGLGFALSFNLGCMWLHLGSDCES